MGLVGWATYVALRHIEMRKVRQGPGAGRSGKK
jgi:hypothetical protein